MHPSYKYLIAMFVTLFIFLAALFITISMIKDWFACGSWKGYACATVKEVRRDYQKVYYVRRLRHWLYTKRWYDFPVITYQVGNTTYVQECRYARKEIGSYSIGQPIPITYNEHSPGEFFFQRDHPNHDDLNWLLCFFIGPGICFVSMMCILVFLHFFQTTRNLLYDTETGYNLSASFSPYKREFYDLEKPSYVKDLEKTMEETILCFERKEREIEGKRSYETYRRRYEQAYPALKTLARFQEDNKPLADFDPQVGPDAYFCSEDEPDTLSPWGLPSFQ